MVKRRKPHEKKGGPFRTALLIYTAVLAVILTVLLCVLLAFLTAYERCLPEKVASSCLSSLSENEFAGLYALCDEIKLQNDEDIEPRKLILRRCGLTCDTLTAAKDAKEYTHDAPVYRIISGEYSVGRITLKMSDGAPFGLTSYEVDKISLNASSILEDAEKEAYTVCVPSGTGVTVNGVVIGKEYLSDENVGYTGRAFLPTEEMCDIYTLELYTVPDVSVNGDTVTPHGNTYDFFSCEKNSFALTVPADASVSIMGASPAPALASVTDFAGKICEFETADGVSLPPMLSYTVYGSPDCDISVTLRGEELIPTSENGKDLVFDYTDASRYTFCAVLPEGASLFLNGTVCGEKYMVGNEAYKALSESPDVSDAFGTGKCYIINGFLTPPTALATLDGKELYHAFTSKVANEIRTEFLGASSDELEEARRDSAEAFVKAYIHYASYGYEGLDENAEALVALTKYGSPAQKKILRSKESFAFVNKGSYTISVLHAHDFILLADGSFFCTVDFDVTLRYYRTEKPYCGTLSLICTPDGLVSGFTVNTSDG